MKERYINILNAENHFLKYKDINTKLLLGDTKMNSAPFFSVLVPTYGRPTTLGDTIRSVLNQIDFDDFELLILDDDPEHYDGTSLKVAESFHDPRLRYYLHSKNLGQCGNWNRGVELARGEYIIIVHDDDVISPYHMKRMYEFLAKKPVYGVIGVRNLNFSNDLPQFEVPQIKIRYNQIKLDNFFWGHYFGIAGMTWNRHFSVDIGGYSEEDYPMHDSIFIMKSILYGKVYLLDDILAGYRIGVNVSLKPETMHAVIEGFHLARKQIAGLDKYHGMVMKFSEASLLMNYINSANSNWKYCYKLEDFLYLLDNQNADFSRFSNRNLILKACNLYEKLCFKFSWRTI